MFLLLLLLLVSFLVSFKKWSGGKRMAGGEGNGGGGEGGLMFDVLSRSDPSFELLAVSSFNKMFQQHVYHHYHHYCFAAVMKAATRWHLAGENSPLNKNNSAYIQNDWFNRMSIGYWKEPKPKMSLNFSFHLSFFLSFFPSFLLSLWRVKRKVQFF